MRFLWNLLLDAIDFFRPLNEDFGDFGVLVRDESGNMVPMDQAYLDAMQADVDERIEDFWLQKEAEAFEVHGDGILRVQ